MQTLGCPDVRIVEENPITLEDGEVAAKIGMVKFRSVTIRVFKIPLEDRCEDYGQLAIYKGTMPEYLHGFDLDDHHYFETGKPLRVCANTYDMLASGRYAAHFELMGDKAVHFGLFDCSEPKASSAPETGGACC